MALLVGDYLYVFGANANTSYKFNIRTKQRIGKIATQNLNFGMAFNYSNYIYVVGYDGSTIGYMRYDIQSNSSKWVQWGYYNGSGKYGLYAAEYNNEVYAYLGGYYGDKAFKINMQTDQISSIPAARPRFYIKRTKYSCFICWCGSIFVRIFLYYCV